MTRFNLLSLLLAAVLVLLCSFSQTEVQAAVPTTRQLLEFHEDFGRYPRYLGNMFNDKRFRLPALPSNLDLLTALKKRQIRYHPCYFNPVSCFRKK